MRAASIASLFVAGCALSGGGITISDFDTSTGAINVTGADDTFDCTITATGATTAGCEFRSPSGRPHTCFDGAPVGNVYSCTVTVEADSEPGNYVLEYVFATDGVTTINATKAEIDTIDAGAPTTTVVVTSTSAETAPPGLLGFSATPNAMDAAVGGPVACTATVDDPNDRLRDMSCHWLDPSGDTYDCGGLGATCTFDVEPGAEAGYWTLDFVLVRDKQLNTQKYTAAQVQLLTPGDTLINMVAIDPGDPQSRLADYTATNASWSSGDCTSAEAGPATCAASQAMANFAVRTTGSGAIWALGNSEMNPISLSAEAAVLVRFRDTGTEKIVEALDDLTWTYLNKFNYTDDTWYDLVVWADWEAETFDVDIRRSSSVKAVRLVDGAAFQTGGPTEGGLETFAVYAPSGVVADIADVTWGLTQPTPGCTETTCVALGHECGEPPDGCGGILPSCGTCTGGETCGGGGTPYECGGATPDMIAHYEFDANCTTDSSGSGNAATCVNGAIWTNTDGRPTAGSVSLDGSNDYVLVGGAESLYDFDTENFTVAAWVKLPPTQTGDYNSLWGKSDPGSNGAGFSTGRDFNGDGTGDVVASTVVDAGGLKTSEGPSGIWDNTWHHVTQVRNGTTLTTHVDGLAGTPVTIASTLLIDDNAFWIGAYTNYANGYTQGLFDDFRVYDRALTAQEIFALAGVTTGFLTVDVSGLNPSCVGSVDWSISPGGYSGTGAWGPTLVADDTYTITWGDSIYDCVPPGTVQKVVAGNTQTFDLVATDYALRNTTRQINVAIRQDGGDCTPAGCAAFGPWTLTATNFAGEGTLATGTGTFAGETICASGCDHTASILDGRNYTATFGAETGWTDPGPGNATAGATPQTITGDYLTPGTVLWASTEQTTGSPFGFTATCCEYAGVGEGCGACSDANGTNVSRVTLAGEGLPAHGGDTYAIRQYVGNQTWDFWRSELGVYTVSITPELAAHMLTGASTYFVMDVYIPSEITMGGNFLSLWDFHSVRPGRWATCPGIMLQPDYQCGGCTMRLRIDAGGCSPGFEVNAAGTELPVGEWFELEIEYRWHTTQGGATVWVNGVQAVTSGFNRDTRGSGDDIEFYSKVYGAQPGTITPQPIIIYRKNYKASASPFH